MPHFKSCRFHWGQETKPTVNQCILATTDDGYSSIRSMNSWLVLSIDRAIDQLPIIGFGGFWAMWGDRVLWRSFTLFHWCMHVKQQTNTLVSEWVVFYQMAGLGTLLCTKRDVSLLSSVCGRKMTPKDVLKVSSVGQRWIHVPPHTFSGNFQRKYMVLFSSRWQWIFNCKTGIFQCFQELSLARSKKKKKDRHSEFRRFT